MAVKANGCHRSYPHKLHGPYTVNPMVKLVAGGKVEVQTWFTAVHMGAFVVEMCLDPGETIVEEWFERLQRDPTDTSLSPYIKHYPDTFFLLEDACMINASYDNPLKSRWLIPKQVTPHAILRYYWQTGNSCSANPASSAMTANPVLFNWTTVFKGRRCRLAISVTPPCGDDCPNKSCLGEQFKNCADVVIDANGDPNNVITSSNADVVLDADHVITTTRLVTSRPLTTHPTVVTRTRMSSIPGTSFPTVTSSQPTPPPTPTRATSKPMTSLMSRATRPDPSTASTSREVTTMMSSVTALRPFSTSQQAISSSTTTNRGVGLTCYEELALPGSREECRDGIRGVAGSWSSLCRSYCDNVLPARDWCSHRSACNRLNCISTFYGGVCARK